MLRVLFTEEGGKLTVTLQGRLAGMWARELREAVLRELSEAKPLLIDLADGTFVDEEGEEVLKWLHQRGGGFIAGTALSNYLCERLAIRSAPPKRRGSSPVNRPESRHPAARKTNSRNGR